MQLKSLCLNRLRNFLPSLLLAGLTVLPWTGCDRRGVGEDSHDHAGHEHGADAHGHGHGGEDEHEETFAKGPHGGRLLEGQDISLEVTIQESGVPPHFRIYANSQGKPVSPGDVELRAVLRRMGGRVDQHTFQPDGDALRGEQVVYEPHSFKAEFTAQHGGKTSRWSFDSPEARTEIGEEAARQAGIQVAVAGTRQLRSVVVLPGEVRFNEERTAAVAARFDGVITEAKKSLGEPVEAGETLAILDSRALADARADYIESVHRLELAQEVFVREKQLMERKIGVEQDFLKTRHEMEEAEIRKQTARQKLVALGLKPSELDGLAMEPSGNVVTFQVRQPFAEGVLSRFQLASPLKGVVVGRDVATGQAVRADEVLYRVSDLSVLWVDLALFPGRGQGIAPGMEVQVSSGEAQGTGRIRYISPFVVEPSRALTVRVEIPNPAGIWRPGQFVEGRVVTGENEVPVAVPLAALQTFRDWQVVFLNEGLFYEPAVVETGRRDGDWIEITSGLVPGQKYVAHGSYVVKADILKSSASHDHDH